jgi:pimeloyl-ACP methyl ester carboxylesterase
MANIETNKFNRRRFLATSAGLAFAPSFAFAQSTSHADHLAAGSAGDAASLQRRLRYLEETQELVPKPLTRILKRKRLSLKINGYDKSWDEWLQRTGELPPDFAQMPSVPHLPEPLVLHENGRDVPIQTRAQWERKREWIRSEYEHWISGKMPPAPDNLRSSVVKTTWEGSVKIEEVLLQFGPNRRAELRLSVMTPAGAEPLPVYLTNQSRWRRDVNTAIRRGYMVCIYKASQPSEHRMKFDPSEQWRDLYPEYDFGGLARWAWGAMRAIDYLYTLPHVDTAKIGLEANSRYAKMAPIAAAFDERIGAVVPSRGNFAGAMAYRYTTPMFGNQHLDEGTRYYPHWFVPRFRFFIGREHKLPVDQNLLLSLIAPRGLMLSQAYTEHQGNPWAIEQTYRSVLDVYRFLGKENHLQLYQQPGEHGPTVDDIESYFDFFDSVFGRRQFKKYEQWISGYSFEKWKRVSGVKTDPLAYPKRNLGDFLVGPDGQEIRHANDWLAHRNTIREKVRWVLGTEPPGLATRGRSSLRRTSGRASTYPRVLFNSASGKSSRPVKHPKRQNMVASSVRFGDQLRGHLYFMADEEGKPRVKSNMPVVVWLHPYNYAQGYSRFVEWPFSLLTQAGFGVLAFDQVGFGTRVEQAKHFYQRYPDWSVLGRMVTDTRAAIDAVVALDVVDPCRIYVLGSSLGAKVGLFTAALDNRIAGVALATGFAPLRLQGPDKGNEGIRHYSHLHGLLPNLGYFEGNEDRLPVDYDDVLSLIAPRPLYVLAPTLDRYHPVDDVRATVDSVRRVYKLLGREDALTLETPRGFNAFNIFWQADWQGQTYEWLASQAEAEPLPWVYQEKDKRPSGG